MARPTTVSRGFPGALVTVTVSPIPTTNPSLASLVSITIWPVRCGQWPAWSVRSSTGPPGVVRPARVSGGRTATGAPGEESAAVTFASANGPAAAVTCGRRAVAASCAGVAREVSIVATTCAPRCAEKAWSNVAWESTTSVRPRTEDAVETTSTRAMTIVWTPRRRPIPPRTAPATAPGLIAAPRPCGRSGGDQSLGRSGPRAGGPPGGCSAPPVRGCG